MNSGARWVVLTYHSREDRLVKEAFKEGERQRTLKILTKHVIRPAKKKSGRTQDREVRSCGARKESEP